MSNNTGYVDNIPFIHKWAAACKPYEIDINLRFHAMESRLADENIRVVDLGCGTGATLLLLAESMPDSEFLGIDFNAEHIEWANEFASKSKLKNIRFERESFATTLEKEYGTFDLVICQGIYSWVSDTIRHEALSCIDRLASSDAALQISWNTEAGYAQLLPLRSLLREFINVEQRDQQKDWSRFYSLIETLETKDVPWFKKNPVGRERIDGWKKSDPRYLAHEYLNESWHLTNFNDLSRDLSRYGFEFGGYSFFERWQLIDPELAFDASHPGLEEMITELAMGVPHRNDTFVRGRQQSTNTVDLNSLDLETACFACPQPTDLVPVQLIAYQSKKTTGIMHQCLEGPKTVAELLQIYNTEEPKKVITKIRDELSRGMIIRIDPDAARVENSHSDVDIAIETTMEYASAFSRNLIDDNNLLSDLAHFPSKITRGGIQIPPTIALLVDVFCQSTTEEQWFLESQKRMQTCGIEIDEEELRKSMQSCVKSWIPFMLFHQILQA